MKLTPINWLQPLEQSTPIKTSKHWSLACRGTVTLHNWVTDLIQAVDKNNINQKYLEGMYTNRMTDFKDLGI